MRKILPIVLYILTLVGYGQAPHKPTASEIFESIKKLQFLGSVLYIAAHPDDENTKLITHFANHYKADVTYLSLTRGDGGQNLIGSELGDLLGVIRTYELLEARKVDGSNQLFTRAVDFGYSKHPDETFQIWNKDVVLGDIVWAIRTTQPDIIINRFDHRSPGTTHGHHTGSAMLSVEAFHLAAQPDAFPNQLSKTQPWQPKRLFFNTSWWFYGSQEKFEKADKSNLYTLTTGQFYPALGLSDSEISALSRSKHQSQGFGNTGSRGQEKEYLELLEGEMPNDSPFEGIDTSWNRLAGGAKIGALLQEVEQNFDFTNPAASVPQLLKAYQLIKQLEPSHWRNKKLDDITEIIAHCSGLFLEAVSEVQYASPGDSLSIHWEAINRSDVPFELVSISYKNQNINSETITLNNNNKINNNQTVKLINSNYTTPYWLVQQRSAGTHQIEDLSIVGLPHIEFPHPVVFEISLWGESISFTRNLVYKFNSPVTGEVYQPFQLLPPITGKFDESVYLFTGGQPQEISITLEAGSPQLSGQVWVEVPSGWQSSTPKPFNLNSRGEKQRITFQITPPNHNAEGKLQLRIQVGDQIYSHQAVTIDYPHIPYQKVLLNAQASVSHIDLQKRGEHIGYITGAGDEVAACLRQIGYQVTDLTPQQITSELLTQFDAVVLGIRAYNTLADLEHKMAVLFDYVAQGGNVIVQYNTSRELLFQPIAPYPITLSRDRVTDETAPVTWIDPKHKVLHFPNQITSSDFDNWVQERGLYFASDWDPKFKPILKMNDPKERATQGALLIAPYGKGFFTYTGLSFFRQLPQGVSGAYRLFANLIALNQQD